MNRPASVNFNKADKQGIWVFLVLHCDVKEMGYVLINFLICS